jgi:hypothetical protein
VTPEALKTELQKPWHHGEHFDARGARIDAPVVLDGLTLRGFDLSGAQFAAGLSARGATFLGLAWLMDARIDDALDLTGAQFRIDLRAEGLTADAVLLDCVQLRGVLALARLRAKRLSLVDSLVLANLTLERAEVAEADLSRAEIMGGIWADGARLGRVASDGSEVHGRLRNWAGF